MRWPSSEAGTHHHRIVSRTGARTALVTTRRFRAPPQTISAVGLIGGGHLPRPGEVSRAHHGVLFLDARPECRRHVLEVWRQPLDKGIAYRPFRVRRQPGGTGRVRGTDAPPDRADPMTRRQENRHGHDPQVAHEVDRAPSV